MEVNILEKCTCIHVGDNLLLSKNCKAMYEFELLIGISCTVAFCMQYFNQEICLFVIKNFRGKLWKNIASVHRRLSSSKDVF